MQSEIVVSKSMKTTIRLQRLPTTVVLMFMIVLGVVMAVDLTYMLIIQAVFASAAYSDDIVSAHPGSRDTLYGAVSRGRQHSPTEGTQRFPFVTSSNQEIIIK